MINNVFDVTRHVLMSSNTTHNSNFKWLDFTYPQYCALTLKLETVEKSATVDDFLPIFFLHVCLCKDRSFLSLKDSGLDILRKVSSYPSNISNIFSYVYIWHDQKKQPFLDSSKVTHNVTGLQISKLRKIYI